ncbi:hypothetical protein BsWGS_22560 [Bradybaena similaris]
MRLYLLIPVVLALTVLEFVAGPNTNNENNYGFKYTEHKLEPEFKYGDMTAFLSCNLTNTTGHFVGQAVQWYKNNISVETDKEHYTVLNNNTLRIYNPKRIHSGVYFARFKIFEQNVLSSYNCSVRYFAKPLILDFPKSVYLQEGDDLELKCNIKGYPPAMVTWSRKDVQLLPSLDSSHIMLYAFNNVENARIVIKNIHHEEAGDYVCLAYSSHFNYSVSKHVVVRISGKMDVLWPLLGILICVLLMALITAAHEANASKRIKREEAILYRESFMVSEANKESEKT